MIYFIALSYCSMVISITTWHAWFITTFCLCDLLCVCASYCIHFNTWNINCVWNV